MPDAKSSLQANLAYEPRPLGFGTSGRRGEVIHLSQLEIYVNVMGELEFLRALPISEGGIAGGDEFYFAHDLRPSSTQFAVTDPVRGEICQAVEMAVRDAGMKPVNLGAIPTPALTYFALSRGKGSIMVTGSHIPFNRNGYKLNTSTGELLKEQEAPIGSSVQAVRERIGSEDFAASRFNEFGMFKAGHREVPPATDAAWKAYLERYLDFFGHSSLSGLRVLLYEHSAVGRDLLGELLTRLGVEVIPAGRSEEFVPIDTENINAAHLGNIQRLVDDRVDLHSPVSAVVSTDGDSDRPLLLAVEEGRVRFFPGDLLGMITAEYLGADAVVVPISCNDAIDRGSLAEVLEPKTRIGSPYVIAGMNAARAKGRRRVCGWEANGGFLAGSDIERNGRVLKALATRDAVLPLLCVLFSAREQGRTLSELFARLPQRYSRAALLPEFPQALGKQMVRHFTPGASSDSGHIRAELESLIPADLSLGPIVDLDYTDGVRIGFHSGEVLHFRPSGNADELRVYAVADTEERAAVLASRCVADPDGILRSMARSARAAMVR
ncbi:MAG TPA: hypothetical protein VMH28_12265 [Candidatus Acidoferrales bacterium]|nr:hypothetical protein [Candidatus Acidoferrales bacterium]